MYKQNREARASGLLSPAPPTPNVLVQMPVPATPTPVQAAPAPVLEGMTPTTPGPSAAAPTGRRSKRINLARSEDGNAEEAVAKPTNVSKLSARDCLHMVSLKYPEVAGRLMKSENLLTKYYRKGLAGSSPVQQGRPAKKISGMCFLIYSIWFVVLFLLLYCFCALCY